MLRKRLLRGGVLRKQLLRGHRRVGPRSVVWHSDGTHASLGTECYSPGWTSEGGAATPSSERARRRSHYGTPTRYAFDAA